MWNEFQYEEPLQEAVRAILSETIPPVDISRALSFEWGNKEIIEEAKSSLGTRKPFILLQTTAAGLVLAFVLFLLSPLALEWKFRKIQIGLTYEQVERIMGKPSGNYCTPYQYPPGKFGSIAIVVDDWYTGFSHKKETQQVRSWRCDEGSIYVLFENNLVVDTRLERTPSIPWSESWAAIARGLL